MYSIKISVKLTFLVFSGFVLHISSFDNKEQCFDVGGKSFCYFRPNISSVDWETAWKTCRDLKSTLPVILDKEVQAVLVKYLNNHFSILPVWTSGRYIGNNEWKWINGQAFRGTDKPLCRFVAPVCPHETRAVLSSKLEYEARTPDSENSYICSFKGASCAIESRESTRWEAGCLEWMKNDRRKLNEARNICIERGGDLATFTEHEDLKSFQQLLLPYDMFKNSDTAYWIGLHRKWWIWNATDVQDIKYNLLKTNVDDRLDCLYITERSDEWSRDSCAKAKNVICQTVSYNKDIISTTNVFIGAVIAALAVATIIVVLLVLIKKRGNVAEVTLDAGSLTNPATPPQNTFVQCPDDTYATIDLDDDLENLNYENGPNPSTLYTKVAFSDGPSADYSEPADFPASEMNISTAVYREPCGISSVTPVYRDVDCLSSDISSEVGEPGQQKKSEKMISPPIKIGPKGDIYTLPISPN